MYTLINKLGWSTFLSRESPTLLLSWIIAEIFYKFGSFTLEAGSFFVTWYATGFLYNKLLKR